MNKSAVIDLSIKSIDNDKRLIEGWATKAEEDRVGDWMVPQGAIYQLPMPFLLDHDHKKAVGEVDRVEVTSNGIRFWAHIKKIAEEGEAKNLTDYAWTLVKSGLRRAVSIGFRPLDAERVGNGVVKITKWNWFELSAVSVPALASATITSFKGLGDDTFVSIQSVRDSVQLITRAAEPPRDTKGSIELIRASSGSLRLHARP